MTDQEMSATIYRGLFTDSEWQIIDYALSEYQDHLDEDDNEIESTTQFKQNSTQSLPSQNENFLCRRCCYPWC